MTRSPAARLLRALDASARGHGLTLCLIESQERAWSSATFTGQHLTLAVAIAGGDSAAWLNALPEEDLPVPGRLVADLVVRTHDDATTLEVLLLEA
ncbi:hypothetical protein M9979_03325 [Sphingomonas sp. RP10(2022)]|uniref:Uncharacterized protein n=1 Tax=Sphingomonas liriopis TaxID=2949094 RepID=A0A9X2HUR1_9SPHN|nr:hypothetical protein [Sphingomonas liriopis]MCP3733909.1 hypothetical protein [Sphingomonas liriopis]